MHNNNRHPLSTWATQYACAFTVALCTTASAQPPPSPTPPPTPAPLAAPTTATVAIKRPADFAKLSDYYAYGAQVWQDERKQALAAKDSQAELAAIIKWQAWNEAADMARLAEQKSSITGEPVKMLPTPGMAVVTEKGRDNVAIRITGSQTPELDITKDPHKAEHLQLYSDYIYAMGYWYNMAKDAKFINDAAGQRESLQKAMAFELAYLAIKNAEIQAEAAGTVAHVTPVPNLPSYPGQQNDAPLERVAKPVKPLTTPAPAALATSVAATTQTLAQATPAPTAPLVQLTHTSFRRETNQGLWLVEFGADWCGICRFMKPTLMELSAELNGKAKIGYVDVMRHKALSQQFRVTGLPTFVIVKNGMIKGTASGMKKKQDLVKLLGL